VQTKAEGPFGTPFHPGYVVPKFVRGFCQMFLWYEDDSSQAGREYLEGKISLGGALRRLNLVPLLVFWSITVAGTVWLLIRWKPILARQGPYPIALLVWLGTYFLFFAWWLCPDPWKWTFTLGPFLVLIVLSLAQLSRWGTKHVKCADRLIAAALWVLAGACMVSNCTTRMWPESQEENARLLQISRQLGAKMIAKDAMLSPYGRLVDYLEYFEGRRGISIYYTVSSCWQIGRPLDENRERALARIEKQVRHVRRAGGRVFVEQVYDPDADDMLHPWTIYRYYFGWESAREDIGARLARYKPQRALDGYDDVHVLAGTGNDAEP
jgi:hypothetical protein